MLHGIPEVIDSKMTSGRVTGEGAASACCDLVVDLCNKRLRIMIVRHDISTAHYFVVAGRRLHDLWWFVSPRDASISSNVLDSS